MDFYPCFNYRQIKTIHHSYLSAVRQSPRSQTSPLNSLLLLWSGLPFPVKSRGGLSVLSPPLSPVLNVYMSRTI